MFEPSPKSDYTTLRSGSRDKDRVEEFHHANDKTWVTEVKPHVILRPKMEDTISPRTVGLPCGDHLRRIRIYRISSNYTKFDKLIQPLPVECFQEN